MIFWFFLFLFLFLFFVVIRCSKHPYFSMGADENPEDAALAVTESECTFHPKSLNLVKRLFLQAVGNVVEESSSKTYTPEEETTGMSTAKQLDLFLDLISTANIKGDL